LRVHDAFFFCGTRVAPHIRDLAGANRPATGIPTVCDQLFFLSRHFFGNHPYEMADVINEGTSYKHADQQRKAT